MELPTQARKSALGKGPGLCGAHYMLSLKPNESLNPAEWQDVLDTTMKHLGYNTSHKYFGVLHEDTDNQHLHIVANRTSMDNHLLLDESNDFEKLMAVARQLEVKYANKIDVVLNPNETWGKNLEMRELTNFSNQIKDGAPPSLLWKHTLIARIAQSLEEVHLATTLMKGTPNPTLTQLVRTLKSKKIDVEFSFRKNTDEIIGISYIFQNRKISGRDLKRSRLTFQKLTTQEGILYDKVNFRALSRTVLERTYQPTKHPQEFRQNKDKSNKYFLTGFRPLAQTGETSLSVGRGNFRADENLNRGLRKSGDRFFAIKVEMPSYHYSIARKMMPPSYFNGRFMIFSFKEPYKQVQNEIEANHLMQFMIAAMEIVQAFFGLLKAKCELVENYPLPLEDNSPVYEYLPTLTSERYRCANEEPKNTKLPSIEGREIDVSKLHVIPRKFAQEI
jgi:hypothetical protein